MDLQRVLNRSFNTSFSEPLAKGPLVGQQPDVVVIGDDSGPVRSSVVPKGRGQRKIQILHHPEHSHVPKNTVRELRTYKNVDPTGLKNLWEHCGNRVIALESGDYGVVPRRWFSMIARNAKAYLKETDLFTVTVSVDPNQAFSEELWDVTDSECHECGSPTESSNVNEHDYSNSSPSEGSTPTKAAVTSYHSPAGNVKDQVSTPHPKTGQKVQRGYLNNTPSGNSRVSKRSANESEGEYQDNPQKSKKKLSWERFDQLGSFDPF